jgi:RTX calcium-binding nonapeptide repeat (4 copies)
VDRLSGDAGRDTLFSQDGRRDVLDGGPGPDRAHADRGVDRAFRVERFLVKPPASATEGP